MVKKKKKNGNINMSGLDNDFEQNIMNSFCCN